MECLCVDFRHFLSFVKGHFHIKTICLFDAVKRNIISLKKKFVTVLFPGTEQVSGLKAEMSLF